ncbi:hypothetical protein AOC36_08535 [Erysipelothrix larvae]|uniref:DAGKc domain-containing protein n=1 Tax=Erysipelothrix larvae TaxID=1514105 RepID=A0A0X8H0W8_9FIRM|nr:YegS/Rv2252/BmrU family lipid kinase [Erysipelothrix larvae]AMC94031.1 hypothetical protein AOC36_08535 [Erysipelothrix larvae]
MVNKNLLVIFNPVSGKNSGDLDLIQSTLDDANKTYDLLKTKNEKSVEKYLKNHRDTYDVILVAGGDGTISQTIDAMIHYDIKASMCIYPKGSTNEFALALGITKDSLHNLANNTQEPLKIDIGAYNDNHSFIYSMTFGNFTHITYKTPQQLKNIFGHIAYWLYGIFTFYFLKIRTYDMKVTCDDEVYEGQFVFGGISNSNSLGTVIQLPEVSFNDGEFELMLIRKPKKHKDFRNLLLSLVMKQYDNELFIQTKGKDIRFESKREYSWNKDGEFAGRLNSLHVCVRKDYLTLYR